MGTKSCSDIIKNCDAFSKPISFSRNRRDPFSTLCGGIISILIIFTMGAYLYILLNDPWEKGAPKTTTSRRNLAGTQNWNYTISTEETYIPHDYYNDSTQYNPFYDGFNMAIMFASGTYDPTMFEFIWFVQNTSSIDYIPTKFCDKNDFPVEIRDYLDIIGIGYSLCPDPSYYKKLFLVGNRNLAIPEFNQFGLRAVKCSSIGSS